MQTTPFKVVTGTKITPKQPFAHLYQHIRQRDPKLAETIDRLAAPVSTTDNLSNPLQNITYKMPSPAPSDKTDWATVLSNDPNDTTIYYPIIAYANIVTPSSTDVELDIQISHDSGANFISILNNPLIILAGANVSKDIIVTFAKGSYFRNLDLSYGQLTSVAFDGAGITFNVLFQ